MELSGPICPLITPYTDDGSAVSDVRLARLVRLAASKFQLATFMGEVGEFAQCGIGERKAALEAAMFEAKGTIGLLVNVTTSSTTASIDLAKHAKEHGARAALVTTPLGGPYFESEIVRYVQLVRNYGELPIIFVPRGSAGVAKVLGSEQGVYLAEGADSNDPTLDQFSLGIASADPLDMFEILPDKGVSRESVGMLLRTFGSARVIKALAMAMDVDFGPVRGPYSITEDLLRSVRQLFAPNSERLDRAG